MTASTQLVIEGAVAPGRCTSTVLVLGRTLRCHWHEGHRGDGASLFDFHGRRFRVQDVDVLITWSDAQAGTPLAVAPKKSPPKRVRDRTKLRLVPEVPRG